MRIHITITDDKGNHYEGNADLTKTKKITTAKGGKIQKKEPKKYTGLIGGIQLLIDNGFFKKPVLVTEVNEELRREGYFYTVQAVDTILRRDMVKRKKILTRAQIDGVWQYVLRK